MKVCEFITILGEFLGLFDTFVGLLSRYQAHTLDLSDRVPQVSVSALPFRISLCQIVVRSCHIHCHGRPCQKSYSTGPSSRQSI